MSNLWKRGINVVVGELPKSNSPPESQPSAADSNAQPELLAMLGHELRNPLAPIRNSAQLLRYLCTDARQLQAVDIISRNVVHLTRMLDDLLDAARLRRGVFTLKKQSIDIAVIVREVLENIQPAIDRRRQSLLISLPATPVRMFSDPVRLGQILFNLLDNANRYTADAGNISLKAFAAQSELVVEITDDGEGIDPAVLPRLFNVFAQAPQPLDRSQGGLGLGLAIARNLAEMHGGTIAAESPGVGRGSRFTLRLPIGFEESASDASAGHAIKPRAYDTSRRVLIIEDYLDIATSLELALSQFGFTTRIAGSGEEGLAMAEEFRPDAVVLDIGLPGINGFEVAKRLREMPALSGVVLIGLSGYAPGTLPDKTAHLAFQHFLVKPAEPMTIATLVDTSLTRVSKAGDEA